MFLRPDGSPCTGAAENNLRDVDAAFPIGCLTCVTGVSGSGKSTLVDDILRRTLCRNLYRSKETPGKHRSISGQHQIDKVVVIDQSPIGRSPRSNPATYTGAFTAIRELFSMLPSSKLRGFTPGTFSFNTKGGRCESCQGDGLIKIDMHFLSDVYVHCEACGGRRYNQDTLDIHFKGKNIAEVLDMSLDEAVAFFRRVPGIHDKLKTLCDVGLGYLKLGQSATTLSGGEAQRIKLSAELARKATGRTLYILDEPTTGLQLRRHRNATARPHAPTRFGQHAHYHRTQPRRHQMRGLDPRSRPRWRLSRRQHRRRRPPGEGR